MVHRGAVATAVAKARTIIYEANKPGLLHEKNVSFGGVAAVFVKKRVNFHFKAIMKRREGVLVDDPQVKLLEYKVAKPVLGAQEREAGTFERALIDLGPPYDDDTLPPFLKKIKQWNRVIVKNAAKDEIRLEGFYLFGVENGSAVRFFVSASFDHLRLSFDRISRHQVVSEVARFVVPHLITDEKIVGDQRHHL